MKKLLFLFILTSGSVYLYCDNIDSLGRLSVVKKNKFVLLTPGYGRVYKNNVLHQETFQLGTDYEYFYKNKFSVSNGLVYKYSDIKNELIVNHFQYNFAMRYYFKIRKRLRFLLFSSISLFYRDYHYINNQQQNLKISGLSFSSGLGYHCIPIRLKKKTIARFGFQINLNLFSMSSNGIKSPYSTIGVLYKINK